jgi:hypothetical protein
MPEYEDKYEKEIKEILDKNKELINELLSF